jgi:hypothetical protein
MKKSIISLVTLFSILVIMVSPVSATCADPNNAPVPIASGRLTFEDGTCCDIEGKLVSTNTQCRSSSPIHELTYQFDILASNIQDASLTVSQLDDTVSSRVYLTIYYSSQNSPTEYLLTAVSGYWELKDSRVSVESATVTYGCSGFFPTATTQHAWDVPVSNNFTCYTGFTNFVNANGGVMGAHLTVNYLMGTARRWSFTISNLLFNNNPF